MTSWLGPALGALLVVLAPPSASGARLCTSTRGNVCQITDNRTLSRALLHHWSGSILFVGSHWQCAARAASYESIRIEISASDKISLTDNSLLHCATIVLEARTVEISENSEVSANGTSFAHEPSAGVDTVGRWSAPPRGASHGGLGGTVAGCANDDAQLVRRLPLVYGDPFAPWHFGRAAGVAAGRGLGGGRVRVIAMVLILNGTLSAAGTGAEDVEDDGRQVAGSGGSIWVSCSIIQQPGANVAGAVASSQGAVDFIDDLGTAEGAPAAQGGRIIALGGCCRRCLCGGGGRVLVEIERGSSPRQVLVAKTAFYLWTSYGNPPARTLVEKMQREQEGKAIL